jgi:drug/metabolite transporter (DMT)-like permease
VSGQRQLVLAAVAGTVLAWASAFVVIRGVGDSFSPGALTLGRLGVAALVLGGVTLFRPWVAPTAREWLLLVGCGLAWFAVYNIALNAAEQTLDAGTTAMLVNIGPLLIALLAGVFLGEGLPAWLFVGAGISLAGIAIIAISGSTGQVASIAGVLYAVVAAVTYAIGVVLQKVVLRRVPALQVTWIACTVGAVVCLPFLPRLLEQAASASGGARLGVVYLGVVPTALAFTTWAFALARTDAGRMGTTTYIVPVVVIGLAWFFLGEGPTGWQLVGGAVALVGVAVSRFRPTRRRAAVPPVDLGTPA